MNLHDKLKEKRVEAGLTQKELAEILHVSRQTVSSWEVGRTYPDLDILVAIGELYQTPLDDLIKEDSRMVEDITRQVKKSTRRKTTNILLASLLFVIVGYLLFEQHQQNQNDYVNEEGLSRNDLLSTTWRINYDPNHELMDSFVSISDKDLMLLNQYHKDWILPDTSLEEVQKQREEWKEKGLEDGLHHYEDLQIIVEGNQYIVTAYGYRQEFTKLSDTILKDENGIEYYLDSPEESHTLLEFIAEELDVPVE
ncbi:helix-turn-helix transcriptional regulator [Jeotgalibaca caeni]|uniref:helix-turn-helix transcriptional regulator n=1 Tax=Jeotgalibaca caeni TaxID=3028623 RepID=UPI00237DD4E1|nr:helix-turn-helix transcriptional regulator [Jeotgalibaca caeni]MDE1549638.1 helix-turn-helix transcriptional regulator [Jeotgalibaca caeni]